MSGVKSEPGGIERERSAAASVPIPANRQESESSIGAGRVRIVPVLLTLLTIAAAAAISWQVWESYMAAPWTRDGQVRAYTVTMAPEVAGRIAELPVADNQFVHKGDTLMVVDPQNFAIAVSSAQAQVDQAEADMRNKQLMAKRRANLTSLSTSVEERESYAAEADAATAAYQHAVSALAQAKLDLARTRIVSPVNGWITNLLFAVGDYADVGVRFVSLVDADSFWVDGYFEETSLPRIHIGDPAQVRLMSSGQVLRGHVAGIARGITVQNTQAGPGGLATPNPVFTWVRLAQRIPVRIELDHVPPDVVLVAGMTATVQIDAPAAGTPGR
jgi:multidrug resistance efflux pump